jgi:hypothetical protein
METQNIAKSQETRGTVRQGLPDGMFSYQKYQFGYIFEGLGVENVAIFRGRF